MKRLAVAPLASPRKAARKTPARTQKANARAARVGLVLTQSNLPTTDKILEAAAEAGATSAGLVPLRLPFAVKDIFSDWLARHFPDRKENVLNRIRSLRGGKLNEADFGARMRGQGIWAEQLHQMFQIATRKHGMNQRDFKLSTEHFRRPGGTQLSLL